MSWAALFERAAAFDVTEAQITDRLAEHRERDGSTDDEAAGKEGERGA